MRYIAILLLLTGCTTSIQYSPAIEQWAQLEIDKLPPACPRDAIISYCSALRTMVEDYQAVRERDKRLAALFQSKDAAPHND